jgi:hypothetical protein
MHLSGPAREVLASLQGLRREEREEIVRLESAALLANQISQAAPIAGAPRRAAAKSVLKQGVAEKLILNAGGIFLGEEQLKELGVISKGVTLPQVPEYFSKEFLNAPHSRCSGRIAEHIILGFNPTTNNWYCFEKSIVPGSLGTDGQGLSGPWQDELLRGGTGYSRTVGRMGYTSPTDYRPIKSVLDNVIQLQLNHGVAVQDLPFYGVYGRTADTQNAVRGCRVLLGYSCKYGSDVRRDCSADNASSDVGLLAGWNLKF